MPAAFDRVSLAAFWAGIVAAALGLWTAAPANLRPERPLPEGVKSAMLALELLRERDRGRVGEFVDPPELAVAGAEVIGARERPTRERDHLLRAVRRDAFFIAGYDTFLSLAGVLLVRSPFGVPLIVLANAAAYLDVQENRAIVRLLSGEPGPVPRAAALWKWACVFTAFLLMVPAVVPRRGAIFWRTIGLAAAAAALFGGVEGWLALAYENDQLLEAAARKLAPAFVLAAFFFGTRRVLADGLLPALDRLAATRWLGWLSRWPPSEPYSRNGPEKTAEHAGSAENN